MSWVPTNQINKFFLLKEAIKKAEQKRREFLPMLPHSHFCSLLLCWEEERRSPRCLVYVPPHLDGKPLKNGGHASCIIVSTCHRYSDIC